MHFIRTIYIYASNRGEYQWLFFKYINVARRGKFGNVAIGILSVTIVRDHPAVRDYVLRP
jgi:hypothetical protein